MHVRIRVDVVYRVLEGRKDPIFVFYLFFFPWPGEQLGHWADQVLSVGTETKATGKF